MHYIIQASVVDIIILYKYMIFYTELYFTFTEILQCAAIVQLACTVTFFLLQHPGLVNLPI